MHLFFCGVSEMENLMATEEVSKNYNISVDKIKYYEENGLLEHIVLSNGKIEYTEAQIHCTGVIHTLMESGMDMEKVKAFMKLFTVIPFCTSGSSSITQSVTEIRSVCSGANVLDGFRAGDSESLEDWLIRIGQIENQNTAAAGNALIAYFLLSENTSSSKEEQSGTLDAISSASVVTDGEDVYGNTEYIAKLIQEKTGGTLYQIQTRETYSTDFDEVVDQNHSEINTSYLPELKDNSLDISQYDIIFIGYPVWSSTMPRAIYSFLNQYDLSEKTVIPFCTHNGYGSGNSYQMIASLCSDATNLDGLAVAATDVKNAESSVEGWLNGLNLSLDKERNSTMKTGNIVMNWILYDTELADEISAKFPLTVSLGGYIFMKRWSKVLSVFLVMVLVLTTVLSAGTQMSTVNAASKKKSKVLITYFWRYTNTNFSNDADATTSASIVIDGKKKRGTTEMLACLIQKETGGDLFPIQTKNTYPTGYNKVIDQNHKELDEDYLPELKTKVKNIEQYDVVFIGYPIWAEDTPQTIKSFIGEHDLKGKTVIPFCTHGSSGQSGTYNKIRKLCSDSDTLSGFSAGEEKVKSKSTKKRLKTWLKKVDVKSRSGKTIPITIKIGDQTLDGVCYNTVLGKEMMKQFPLTVTMDKFGDREYYGDVAKGSRPTKKSKGKLAFVNGDITYCFENDTMAIFYNQSDEPNLTMRVNCIGRVISDLSVFNELDDSVMMTFDLKK